MSTPTPEAPVVQPQPSAEPPKKKRGGCLKIALGIIGAFIVLGILVNACGSGDETPSTSGAAPTAAPAAPAAAEKPVAIDDSEPLFCIGQAQTISDGDEALEVTPLKLVIRNEAPGDVYPTESGMGWRYAIVTVRFKNTGSEYYKSQVGMWSQLVCTHNAEDEVTAEWMGDTQGSNGELSLDPGDSYVWHVVFSVRKTAEIVSFSYQGPGSNTATWLVK